ncbi:MAG: prepilin peptidase [Zetaproteobacteria bacterium CG02_land_8_20_14_3_00_50_9]|nr:MAG: prepilin peptidase [Zetaproteobacteria bacterium CG17_big_fil_post_rev_8_21_14_2_50_50_13]PIV29128.1 MAG: prepilin peptidase [Zetaproteobacteria bacterium CG02_land_8_20_14_3_00_50_9]
MSTFAAEYRKTALPTDKKPCTGLNALVDDLLGMRKKYAITLNSLSRRAEAIEQRSLEFQLLTDQLLDAKVEDCQRLIRRNDKADAALVNEALAVLAEVAYRTVAMRPYSVQLMGVLAMYYQYAIQMHPGEGKTLTACLAGILAAWRGRSCHIVTSNDYLAGRDAELMQPLYARCNISVAAVLGDTAEADRRLCYRCGVVYATSKELLADFLRDRLLLQHIENPDQLLIRELAGKRLQHELVMQGLHTAIIDEADSVLVDDATTPLIISASSENKMLIEATLAAVNIAAKLHVDGHYLIHRRFNDIEFTDEGEALLAELTKSLHPVWHSPSRREDLLRQALLAKELYHIDTHYVVIDGKVIIVDEKTGRLMHGRSWSYGLHQAIEAKEGVPLSDPTVTQSRMCFQRYFRLYKNLSGMSGTLQNLQRELWRIYKLPLIRIPTRLASKRVLMSDRLFVGADEKWQYVIDEVERMQQQRRPILVGTRSIVDSEMLARELRLIGIQCNVLNAVHDDQEAEIIARAGLLGQVTISTNMAGRGTDILLGEHVVDVGGLHVIATERHESRRVDHQLFGRSARQGQPGSAQAVISLDDYIMSHLISGWMQTMLKRVARGRIGNQFACWLYMMLQKTSEFNASRQRKRMLQDDYAMNEMLSFAKK